MDFIYPGIVRDLSSGLLQVPRIVSKSSMSTLHIGGNTGRRSRSNRLLTVIDNSVIVSLPFFVNILSLSRDTTRTDVHRIRAPINHQCLQRPCRSDRFAPMPGSSFIFTRRGRIDPGGSNSIVVSPRTQFLIKWSSIYTRTIRQMMPK